MAEVLGDAAQQASGAHRSRLHAGVRGGEQVVDLFCEAAGRGDRAEAAHLLGQRLPLGEEPAGVLLGGGLQLSPGDELVEGEAADALEEPEARGAAGVDHDEGVGAQLRQALECGVGAVGGEALPGIQGEASGEHAAPCQVALLIGVQQLPGPAHGGLERGVAGGCIHRATPEHAGLPIEAGEDLRGAEHGRAGRGQLDGEGDAIDPLHQGGDGLGIRALPLPSGARHEECAGFFELEGREGHDPLAAEAQRLPGGDEHGELRQPEPGLEGGAGCIQNLFDIVEHEQGPGSGGEQAPERLGRARALGGAEGGGHPGQQALQRAGALQGAEDCRAGVGAVLPAAGELEGRPGLAEASGSRERDERAALEELFELSQGLAAADEGGRRGGQGGHLGAGGLPVQAQTTAAQGQKKAGLGRVGLQLLAQAPHRVVEGASPRAAAQSPDLPVQVVAVDDGALYVDEQAQQREFLGAQRHVAAVGEHDALPLQLDAAVSELHPGLGGGRGGGGGRGRARVGERHEAVALSVAGHEVDRLGGVGLDLRAEPAHGVVGGAGEAVGVVAPDLHEQLLARDRAAAGLVQGQEQAELVAREPPLSLGMAEQAQGEVEGAGRERQPGRVQRLHAQRPRLCASVCR